MDSRVKVIKILTVSAVILIFLLAISLIINLIKLANTSTTEAKLKAQLLELDKRIEQNDETIAELESTEWLDKYAREHLNMKGRNEEAFTAKEK
ncbi:MAG: septum formation initiator family protein [Clostridiales bacterium]|nr:septum formation initiator family protein [Clostridiales bacterium]